MKKSLTCLFVAMFVVGLTMSGLGCAENQQGAKDTAQKCPAGCKGCDKCMKKGTPMCPKAAAAAKTEPAPVPAAAPAPAKPAPAPAPAPAKPAPAPAPQGEKK